MLKGKYVLLSLAAALVCWQVAGINNANSGIVDPCKSTCTATAGTVLVCPLGDGNALTSAIGGTNCQVSVTVKDNGNIAIAGIPATDMWLVGCNAGLLLCGGSGASTADAATNASGTATFSNEPIAGGCDVGLFVVVQGTIIKDGGTPCLPKCLSVAAHSPDYKSAGQPGDPAPCAADLRCPDSKVTTADFGWFTGHYPTAAQPGNPYFSCADYAAPIGAPLGLADFGAFNTHFAGAGHKCPL
jgi:hypothetical protein